jgi:cyclic pyranopterin monophosphate synthase
MPARTGQARQRSLVGKPHVRRRAVVEGTLTLSSRSARAIAEGKIEKGDPLTAASLAGLSAMKRTAELIPHCHIVPLTSSRVELRQVEPGVRVLAEAEATWSTGVEMEALVGATVALLTVWDMVKYLEKDARGHYPETSLGPVRVLTKEKGKAPRGD